MAAVRKVCGGVLLRDLSGLRSDKEIPDSLLNAFHVGRIVCLVREKVLEVALLLY